MVGGLEELFFVKFDPKYGVLTEVDGFVTQLHCLDALAHVVSVQSTRVEQGVAACHIAVPPVGQLIELGKVVLRRQERHSDREVVAARQEVLDSLSDILARGIGLEEEEPVNFSVYGG